MTSSVEPLNPQTIPPSQVPAEVVLLRETQKRLAILKEDEQDFLTTLSGYIDTQDWGRKEFNAFAQLFRDYVFCLDVIGPAARQIGLRVSVALFLFSKPVDSIQYGYLQRLLVEIMKMNPYSRP